MLEGVFWEPKQVISDGRGAVLHHLRSDEPRFAGFGELYCSAIPPGVVRAWKLHKKICQRMIVPVGQVRFVLYDPRKDSPTYGQTQEITLRRDPHGLFGIPPAVWYGFEGLGPGESLIVNCANEPHDPGEVERSAFQRCFAGDMAPVMAVCCRLVVVGFVVQPVTKNRQQATTENWEHGADSRNWK